MATPVKMPKVGLSDESSIIVQWHKKKGDFVKKGELLFTIQTDKATFDVEAEVDGTILEVFYREGEEVPVLTTVCIIGSPEEATGDFTASSIQELEKNVSEKSMSSVDEDSLEREISGEKDGGARGATTGNSEDRIKISPRAKNLAERAGVDYRHTTPTGPEGRIIERDILAQMESGDMISPVSSEVPGSVQIFANLSQTGLGNGINVSNSEKVLPIEASGFQQDYEIVNLSYIRKKIAKNMYNSLSSTAQLTLHTSFDAFDILAYREKIKENRDKLGLEDITLNDIILYAVSRTLVNHKELNAHLVDDKMLIFRNVHLGVAVDTERGLMVPIVFCANLKSLNEISREVKELVEQCRSGTINPDKLKGGTFTVTNLGILGVESFTPILNPPQTGILGVCSIVYKIKKVGGEYRYYPAMGLSLTFDHRALDGAPAARFLKELKDNLENFSILLAR